MVTVMRDGFAHVDDRATGERLHTKIRYQVSTDGRVGVFLSPTSGPAHVYDVNAVKLTRVSASCSHPVCSGKANRRQLANLWNRAEAANV